MQYQAELNKKCKAGEFLTEENSVCVDFPEPSQVPRKTGTPTSATARPNL